MLTISDLSRMDELIGQNLHHRSLKTGHDISDPVGVIGWMFINIVSHSRFDTAETEIKIGFIQIRTRKCNSFRVALPGKPVDHLASRISQAE